jgi:hypothetical protein
MKKRTVVLTIVATSALFVPIRAPLPPVAALAQTASLGDPEQHKRTVLERLTRLPPTYRGDTPQRLKWEWYDGMCRSYEFEKKLLVEELSAQLGYLLREEYVFRNVKVTYQEIFQLTDKDDDKLVPVLSYSGCYAHARENVFEGLTLLGKQGESKGTITRSYVASTMEATPPGGAYRSHFSFITAVEYKDQKSGTLETAGGAYFDSVNLRWRDIKNRVADDNTEEKATEWRTQARDAYRRSLKASVPKV